MGWCQLASILPVAPNGAHSSPYVSSTYVKNEVPTSILLLGRGKQVSQSISNQTHAQLFCSTPQRSDIVSTIGRPHPPFRSGCGRGSDSTSKPGPESHTLPRTEPAETLTVSEIWSFDESPAWRILLVTNSLTTSRTSSSFSGGKRSVSRSRVWRAVVTTSGSGASLRSISASINKSQRRPSWQVLCTLARRYYTAHGCAAALLEKGKSIR